MGLDVKVYTDVRIAEDEQFYDFEAYVIDDRWDYKIKNLHNGRLYNGVLEFHGVSYAYSSHSRFREKLIKLIGRHDLLDDRGSIKWNELTPEIPFYDFIDFADNEGCLDWEVSAKIFSDFEKFKEKAKSEMGEHEQRVYTLWLETFKHAANKGVVVFK